MEKKKSGWAQEKRLGSLYECTTKEEKGGGGNQKRNQKDCHGDQQEGRESKKIFGGRQAGGCAWGIARHGGTYG